MNSQTTLIRSLPQQDLMNDLKFFIKGTAKKEKCNSVDLTKYSLTLLKCLPAARVAAFEYFSKVFDKASFNYIEAIEVRISDMYIYIF